MTMTHNPAKEYTAMPLMAPDGTEWKPVDYPGIAAGYQVSLYGEVLSPQNRKVKPQVRKGRSVVALRMVDRPTSTTMLVAQLVLSTFDHYAPHLVPEYRDGDGTNCQLINLFWREPTEREARAKKAAATARKGRGQKKRRSPVPQVIPETPAVLPRAVPELEMFRTYRVGGIEVKVNSAGEIPAKGLPQGKLTAAKVAALAKILTAAAEMNNFMGVGP
jgi:hypothetical protein